MLGACCVLALAVATAGTATAAAPFATDVQALDTGSPTAVACDGSVHATATVTAPAATGGTATAVMLVLDVSGSTGGDARTSEISAAQSVLDALRVGDSFGANSVGLVTYQGQGANPVVALGTGYTSLSNDLANLPTANDSSPHNAGIDAATTELQSTRGAGLAKAIVLITDGQTDGANGPLTTATGASAASFKALPGTLEAIGIGDYDAGNLTNWATAGDFHPAAGLTGSQVAMDLGASVATPTTFTLAEMPGANWSLSGTPSTGTVSTVGGQLQWTGTFPGAGSATLALTATRNGNQVFASQNEQAITGATLTALGGSGSVTPPAAISIDVLPCGAAPLATTTCTGSACSVSATTPAGVNYVASIGSPPPGTKVSLATLNTPAPPSGICPGFVPHTDGAELDVRPLSTTANMTLTIPKASLGRTPWILTDICLGTNLPFITAVSSLRNLSPQATFLAGSGGIPGRWWGILPSLPRLDYLVGKGYVVGPWVTNRSITRTGAAVISFTVPFVAGTAGLSTDGKVGYDPKLWG
jgi:Mg-chelatase subunit ChlD